jgi:hypothetical protein
MKLLLFAGLEKDRQRLERCVEGLVPDSELHVIDTVDKLVQRLRQSINGYVLGIIMAASQEEFEKILFINKLLSGLKIIIVVPDRKPETVSAALNLRPRYMSYSDGDLHDVSLVANRMFQRLHANCQLQPGV